MLLAPGEDGKHVWIVTDVIGAEAKLHLDDLISPDAPCEHTVRV